MQNHFELFQLPAQFDIDMAALDAAYREVQGRVHPDRFVNASDAEKRVAMQWATRANEAYQTLRNPQKRAQYLCELHGVDLQTESNTAMPMDFLMEQMALREALDDARGDRDAPALDAIDARLRAERTSRLQQVGKLLDLGDYSQAAQGVRALMFLERIKDDVQRAFEALES
jgi:molecular chaperone HscB